MEQDERRRKKWADEYNEVDDVDDGLLCLLQSFLSFLNAV